MSILVNSDTRLIVQGITGREGSFHTGQMVEYGTNVVGGTSPGKGGTSEHGVPVFNTVKDAVDATNANASIIYVPAPFAPDAIYEAVDAGIPLVICISELIPTLEMVKVYHYVNQKGVRLIGPNCPGLITPGEAKVGIMPGYHLQAGRAGRAGLSQWHADLRSRQRADRGWHRPDDRGRNRWRPDHRHVVRRRPLPLPG